MWLLMQLLEIVFVILGLNVIWEIVKAPFALAHKKEAPSREDPGVLRALQKQSLEDYSQKIRDSLSARAATRG